MAEVAYLSYGGGSVPLVWRRWCTSSMAEVVFLKYGGGGVPQVWRRWCTSCMVEVVYLNNNSRGGVPQLMNGQGGVPQETLAELVYLHDKFRKWCMEMGKSIAIGKCPLKIFVSVSILFFIKSIPSRYLQFLQKMLINNIILFPKHLCYYILPT